MQDNQSFYTKEKDGTIQHWYLFSRYGEEFAVSPRKNAKLSDYKRYYSMQDIGVKIFLTRKEASGA